MGEFCRFKFVVVGRSMFEMSELNKHKLKVLIEFFFLSVFSISFLLSLTFCVFSAGTHAVLPAAHDL